MTNSDILLSCAFTFSRSSGEKSATTCWRSATLACSTCDANDAPDPMAIVARYSEWAHRVCCVSSEPNLGKGSEDFQRIQHGHQLNIANVNATANVRLGARLQKVRNSNAHFLHSRSIRSADVSNAGYKTRPQLCSQRTPTQVAQTGHHDSDNWRVMAIPLMRLVKSVLRGLF